VEEQRQLVVMLVSERQAIRASAGDPHRLLRDLEEGTGALSAQKACHLHDEIP
jgi:hypothetical protein